MDPITYAASGVDIKKAESFVDRLKRQSNQSGMSNCGRLPVVMLPYTRHLTIKELPSPPMAWVRSY